MDQQDSLTNKYLTERDAVYTPKEGFKRTLIFFHGLTSNGPKIHDKCLLGKEYRPFPLDFRVVFPTAPVRTSTWHENQLVTSWFDIEHLHEKMTDKLNEKAEKEIQESLELAKNIVEEEIRIIGGDSRNVYIGGNSQGCALGLHFTLNYDKPLGGFLGFIGWKLAITEPKDTNKNIPIFLGLDELDDTVPFNFSMKTFAEMKEWKNVKIVTDTTHEHSRSPKMNLSCQEWIDERDLCKINISRL